MITDNVGLIVGLTVSMFILFMCLCIVSCCIVVCMCRWMQKQDDREAEASLRRTVVIPNRTRLVSTPASVAALSSTQQPATVNDDTEEAPPSYDVASSFPSIPQVSGYYIRADVVFININAQEGYQYQSNVIAADPEEESRVTVQDQDPPTYSSIAPNANQNCRHLTLLNPQTNGIYLAIQQPDGLTLGLLQPDSLTQDRLQPDGITHEEEPPQPDGLTRDTPQPDGLPQDTP